MLSFKKGIFLLLGLRYYSMASFLFNDDVGCFFLPCFPPLLFFYSMQFFMPLVVLRLRQFSYLQGKQTIRGDANPGYFVSSFMLSCSCQCLNSFQICMGFCTKNIGFSCRSSVRSIGFLELQLALSCFQASDGAIPTRLATNFSLSSAALLSWHGGISLHLWTSSNPNKVYSRIRILSILRYAYFSGCQAIFGSKRAIKRVSIR